MKEKKGKVIFEKKIYEPGPNSLGMVIPKQILSALKLRKGTKVKLMVEHGKHGTYLSLWNPRQQKKESDEK